MHLCTPPQPHPHPPNQRHTWLLVAQNPQHALVFGDALLTGSCRAFTFQGMGMAACGLCPQLTAALYSKFFYQRGQGTRPGTGQPGF